MHKEQGDRCQKTKTKVHTSTGAAAGIRGWHILDMNPPFLDKEVKDKIVKAKGECVRMYILVFVCCRLFRCLSFLAVSVCRQGAPALAPNQPPSCVHSALPLAAGKLVPAICHTAPHTPLRCAIVRALEESKCVSIVEFVCVHCDCLCSVLFRYLKKNLPKHKPSYQNVIQISDTVQ